MIGNPQSLNLSPDHGPRCFCRTCTGDPFVCAGVRRVEKGRNIWLSAGKPCGCECHSDWWSDLDGSEP